jgi:hypothetical protein
VKAVETYEWLTGRGFLVHRFEGRIGDEPTASIELIGTTTGDDKGFPVHTFYGNGVAGTWRLQERGPMTWVLTGTQPVAGKDAKVRCTIIDAGDTLTGRWEYTMNGSDWQPSWDVKSVRKTS